MSLLDGLIGQIAQSAIQNRMGNQMGMNNGMGGMNHGSGLDGMLGNLLGGAVGGNTMGMNPGMGNMGGGMGAILGNILGGGFGNSMGGGFGSGFGNTMGGQQQSGFGGMGKSMLMAALIPLALGFIQRNGGLSGALSKITSLGHSQQANSWMSTDQSNLPLDANAVHQLFDPNELQQVAEQTGMDTSEVADGMANLLPQVIDNLTPNGDTSHEQQANSEIDDILTQFTQAKG